MGKVDFVPKTLKQMLFNSVLGLVNSERHRSETEKYGREKRDEGEIKQRKTARAAVKVAWHTWR